MSRHQAFRDHDVAGDSVPRPGDFARSEIIRRRNCAIGQVNSRKIVQGTEDLDATIEIEKFINGKFFQYSGNVLPGCRGSGNISGMCRLKKITQAVSRIDEDNAAFSR